MFDSDAWDIIMDMVLFFVGVGVVAGSCLWILVWLINHLHWM